MSLDQHRLCIELQRLDWARQLSDEVIQELSASAQATTLQAGEVMMEAGSEIDHVYFVITGRVEYVLFDRLGKAIHRDVLERGSVLGLFPVLLSERSRLEAKAVEPTVVLLLALDELLRLSAKHREFQLAMFRVAANVVKQLNVIDRERPKPSVVGIIHHGDASRSMTVQLARRLRQLGEHPCVASDDARWNPGEGIAWKLIVENGVLISPDKTRQVLQDWKSQGRLLIDLRADHSPEDLERVISYSDVVLWCIQPQDAGFAIQALSSLRRAIPRLSEKTRIVWVLDNNAPAPPWHAELAELASRDFKVHFGQRTASQGVLLQQGVERIVHHLRGVQIGLALGGGAARGMAHLGVLRALEEHGICIDMLAGTSAGAMAGTAYAAGFDPQFATEQFKRDLRPSWLFQRLPGSGYWYLLYKYRSGQFDPMLRKYLGDLRMEQLVIPAFTIAVDLVEGIPLIRGTGDATQNILESINMAPLSLPIVRSDQALVDGGLLNNVPANTLVAQGCNFVIASTVTADLEKDFMGIRSKKIRRMSRFFTTLQVILRQNMIQAYSMNAVGVKPADFVIAPNVTAFDLPEFTRADEMAVIGERTTNESIHRLKEMLSKLDAKLFA